MIPRERIDDLTKGVQSSPGRGRRRGSDLFEQQLNHGELNHGLGMSWFDLIAPTEAAQSVFQRV
jgi:hypothetical protein